MAKTREQKELEAQELVTNTAPESDSVTVEKTEENSVNVQKGGPSYDELISLVQHLSNEIQNLKSGSAQPVNNDEGKMDRILETLANRRADREVTIVHNREMIGGLSTHLELSGMIVDFHSLGEQRLLSWQQFEECVSKYRSFFEQQILLLSNDNADLSDRYNVPCMQRKERSVTRDDLIKLPEMSTRNLEDFVRSLNEADQEFVFTYWLGQCYNRTPGYYDRYKVELLNDINGYHFFDNMLTLMNGDYNRDMKTNKR